MKKSKTSENELNNQMLNEEDVAGTTDVNESKVFEQFVYKKVFYIKSGVQPNDNIQYDLKIFEDFISKYDKHLILTIVYINLVSKLKLHNDEEQKRFIELAKKVYEWL